jgi:C1A family cysteine protease
MKIIFVQGLVSPVKAQGKCGSCVAFATIGAIETCFKKATGRFSDFSEQQLIDCGYNFNGGDGCVGAGLDSYLEWVKANPEAGPVGEEQYPYLYSKPLLSCPEDIPAPQQVTARMTGYYALSNGNEEILKAYVYEHGAAISTLCAKSAEFKGYQEGIFEGCDSEEASDHAVLVVGYGTEDDVDYWLIKNSWGIGWGDDGFMKLRRGVSMCGIGNNIAYVTCEAVATQQDGDDLQSEDEDGDDTDEDEEDVGEDNNDDENELSADSVLGTGI